MTDDRWTYSPPDEEGIYLRMTAEGQIVVHRLWKDDAGRLMIVWDGAICPVESVRKKLEWYWWRDTGARSLPSYGQKTPPEDSVG